MKKNKRTIRLPDRICMLLDELSEQTGQSVSVVIRSLLMKSLEQLLDDAGNWKLDEKQIQQKE